MQLYAVFLPKKMTRLIEWNADVASCLNRSLLLNAAKTACRGRCSDKLNDGQESAG
jgi:hypothetical protein